MKQIHKDGNLPDPIRIGIQRSGLERMTEQYGLATGIEIWECNSVAEVGTLGHLDDCEFQVLIDKKNSRYYLVALTVDPERVRAKVDTTEGGDQIVIPDTSQKPATAVYYTEVIWEEYKLWRAADAQVRRNMILKRIELDRKKQMSEMMVRG